ncbi:ferrioxamine B transporter [Kalmusia sp. IMI 367209]|nr:ferrioxamine B transporter [Kalmusia sp. IMI 367209]
MRRPDRTQSMSAADDHDPDAITLGKSRHLSHTYKEPLKCATGPEHTHRVAERGDASVAPDKPQSDLPLTITEPPTGANSPGYKRMEVFAAQILTSEKVVLFGLIMLLAIAHSLDNFLRVLYQFEVATSFGNNGIIGAINTVSTLSTATLTPMISKSADVFGRPQTLLASVVFYVLGTAVQAHGENLVIFSVGTVFWTIGLLGVVSMFEIIIADITSIRLRVMAFYLPAAPYLATTWVSVTATNSLAHANYDRHWRFGWSAIIYTVCSLPLVIAMFVIEHRAKKRLFQPPIENELNSSKQHLGRHITLRLQQMNVLGWVCFVGIVICILGPWPSVPLVQLHSEGLWTSPAMIAVIIIGALCIPLFYYVERHAKYPMFPSQLLRQKDILTALAMGFLYHLAYYVQHTYLYIGLLVRYDESANAAARITGLYTFTSTFVGIFMGIIISITGDLRWFIRWAAILYLISFTIQIVHPGGNGNGAQFAVSCSQILLGIAGGLFPFPAMAFIQAARKHAHLATLIGAYMTACRMGGGIGQALAGAVWTNVLKISLHKALLGMISESEIGMAYAVPTQFIIYYPWGTRARTTAVDAYIESHRYLCAVGIIASTLLVVLAFLIQDASLEGPQNNESTVDIELQSPSGGDVELKEMSRPKRTPAPLQRSRLPVIM